MIPWHRFSLQHYFKPDLRSPTVRIVVVIVVIYFCWCPPAGHCSVFLQDTGVSSCGTLVCLAAGHWCVLLQDTGFWRCMDILGLFCRQIQLIIIGRRFIEFALLVSQAPAFVREFFIALEIFVLAWKQLEQLVKTT